MNRFTHAHKLLAVVALLLLLPLLLPALETQCLPPYCPQNCPDGVDCTDAWLWADWNNMCTAAALWALGYTVVVCCNH